MLPSPYLIIWDQPGNQQEDKDKPSKIVSEPMDQEDFVNQEYLDSHLDHSPHSMIPAKKNIDQNYRVSNRDHYLMNAQWK